MKGFMKEFKKFISRGNILDMATGVIIGSAFTAIVTSMNKDILSPLIAVFGGKDFTNLVVVLGTEEDAPVLAYGNFITAVINFLITAFILFCIVKITGKMKKKLEKKQASEPTPTPPPTTKKCPYCMSEIAIEATRCPHCTSMLEEQKD